MFEVEWTEAALNALSEAWLTANSEQRRRITQASDALDTQLRENPLDVGESREGSRRLAIEMPLVVTFRVNLQTRTVLVSTVRLRWNPHS